MVILYDILIQLSQYNYILEKPSRSKERSTVLHHSSLPDHLFLLIIIFLPLLLSQSAVSLSPSLQAHSRAG